ncbi:hypothetical protein EDM52_11950 [Brevibacillus invocatus]|uniref:23S rRNA (guanine(745)-N(1))-methyltransferase N-terminal domain-containing protein n=2 Tax=Brevibacillus invocatus TaxID=173959 RepID=A0A3M8CFR2_9BACL|nr:hypothetical protein EDM52_11950 [Brevibacillus invocatus]
MKVMYAKSLLCSSGHCFDLAKQGYVNLLTCPNKTKYDSQLFEARQKVSISGFFEPLISHISERIPHMMKPSCDMIRMLDAGCGEGSHLTAIQNRILARNQPEYLWSRGGHIQRRNPDRCEKHVRHLVRG